ncbi:MAG TPA: YciI family protein [Gammaproteobacteria bacterium]|nr:YciI family protein [Gammaproteobacteria bacterium]
MLYIVQFEDKPDVAALRQKLFQSHLEFLDRNKDKVLVPGGLRDAADRPVGGLWIVEAEDEAGVRQVFEHDPFWVNGLRAGHRINRWLKAFPERKVEI